MQTKAVNTTEELLRGSWAHVFVFDRENCGEDIRDRLCRALGAHYGVPACNVKPQPGDTDPAFFMAALNDLKLRGFRLDVGEPKAARTPGGQAVLHLEFFLERAGG